MDPTTTTTAATAPEALPPPPAANDDDLCDNNAIADPPPPYPTRPSRRTRHRGGPHPIQTQISSGDSPHSDVEQQHLHAGEEQSSLSSGPITDDSDDRAPFLTPSSGQLRNPAAHAHRRRPRSISHASTMSVAPSLAQTVLSLFEQDDVDDDERGPIHLPEDSFDDRHIENLTEDHDGFSMQFSRRNDYRFWSASGWRRYFRPMGRAVYYRSLVHLLFINFPYALAAWIYMFVLTVSGTTLLVALPIGALLCFLDLIGARVFARGELALQTKFHSPLSYPAPYPPRPIFTRYREATTAETEAGRMGSGRAGLVRERSFYKNSYAMFTDPTSYQALFYFIVIKPAITIILLLFILIFVVPSMILVLPAPAALRAVRKLGLWQANIAVEGLYHAVR